MSSEGHRAVKSSSRELCPGCTGGSSSLLLLQTGLYPLFSWLMGLCQTCLSSQGRWDTRWDVWLFVGWEAAESFAAHPCLDRDTQGFSSQPECQGWCMFWEGTLLHLGENWSEVLPVRELQSQRVRASTVQGKQLEDFKGDNIWE